MVEVDSTSTVVKASTVEIESGITKTVVSTKDSAYIEVNPAEYSLTSGGLYAGGGLVGEVPKWLQEAIDREITTGDGNITQVVDDLRILMLSLNAGVSQDISSVNTSLESTNTLLTVVNSKVDSNQAYVVDFNSSTATKDYAKAAASDHVTSIFGPDALATVDSIASTYTDENSAVAINIEEVRAELDNTTVKVTSNDFAIIANTTSIADLEIFTGVSIEELQNQIDGNITTWFGDYSASFVEADTVANTEDTAAILVTGDYVWDVARVQVHEMIGADATINLTTTDFTDEALWRSIYKVIPEAAEWFRADGVDVPLTGGKMWYEVIDGITYMRPKIDPAVETVPNVTKNHIGDLFYDRITGFGQRFGYEDVNDRPDQGIIFKWILITDVGVLDALAASAKAQDTADGKRTIFYSPSTTAPPYSYIEGTTTLTIQRGDMWVHSDTQEVQIWNSATSTGTWVDATTKSVTNILDGTTSLNTAKIGTETLDNYIANPVNTGTDDMVNVYSGDAAYKATLTGMSTGDLFAETEAGILTSYRWNGTLWVETEGASTVGALSDLSDGKRSIYVTPGVPTDTDAPGDLVINVNDLWIPPSDVLTYLANEIYICTSVGPIVFIVATRYSGLITNLQGQVDYKIDTYVQDLEPYLPAAGTAKQDGDYWNCTLTAGPYTRGKVYVFVFSTPAWQEASDVSSSIFDLADSKKTIYGGNTLPEDNVANIVEENDVWIPTSGVSLPQQVGEIYQRFNGDWVPSTRYTQGIEEADAKAVLSQIAADAAQDSADTAQDSADAAQDAADTAEANAQNAKAIADSATTSAGNANTEISSITDDGVLSSNEKPAVIQQVTSIAEEKIGIIIKATEVVVDPVVIDAYNDSIFALNVYLATLTPLWDDTTQHSVFTSAVPSSTRNEFNNKFGTVYSTRQTVLNATATKLQVIADTAQISADTAQSSADTAQSSADGAQASADAAQAAADAARTVADAAIVEAAKANAEIADISSDGVLSRDEKPELIQKLTVIEEEAPGIIVKAQYTNNTIDSQLVADYNNAVTGLRAYLETLVPAWDDLSQASVLANAVPTTNRTVFNAKFSLVYSTRQIVLNATVSQGLEWSAGSSKHVTAPDGAIAGWQITDGSGQPNSKIAIVAEDFRIYESATWVSTPTPGNPGNGHFDIVESVQNTPFSIIDGDIRFNGKVSFGSGQTGTIDEAITASVTQVTVGDKNINITDNLIPTTSLITDVNNAGYQFVGTPIASYSAGLTTFAEVQIVLDGADEVYSPYVDELAIPYYFRFGMKGVTDLTNFNITTLNNSNAVTTTHTSFTVDPLYTIDANTWYVIEGIINPAGGNTDPNGSIRLEDGTKIATVNTFVIPVGAAKMFLGWTANSTISRMKLAKITADTITGSFATTDYVDTTTIDGGRIETGIIQGHGNNYWNLDTGQIKTDYTDGVSGNQFILDSNAAGTSVAPNIEGAYIKGGNIEATSISSSNGTFSISSTGDIVGATLDSSTISARDLVIIGDAGYATKSVLHSSCTVSSAGTAQYGDSVFTYDVQSYNSTSGSNRFTSARPTFMLAGGSYSGNGPHAGWIELCGQKRNDSSPPTGFYMTITVLIGGVSIGSQTVTSNNSYDASTYQISVGGFSFIVSRTVFGDGDGDDNYYLTLYAPPSQTATADVTGNGDLSFQCKHGSAGSPVTRNNNFLTSFNI